VGHRQGRPQHRLHHDGLTPGGGRELRRVREGAPPPAAPAPESRRGEQDRGEYRAHRLQARADPVRRQGRTGERSEPGGGEGGARSNRQGAVIKTLFLVVVAGVLSGAGHVLLSKGMRTGGDLTEAPTGLLGDLLARALANPYTVLGIVL